MHAEGKEHALAIASIMFLQKGTVPKTRSGKIARAWCRKAYNDGSLKVIHHESFHNNNGPEAVDVAPQVPLEIEGPANNPAAATTNDTATAATTTPSPPPNTKLTPDQVRNLSKEEIIRRLIVDLSRVASVPPSSIDKSVPMISTMDS